MENNYGNLNAHNMGVVLKEIVRRIILSIRTHRFALEVSDKEGYDGGEDMVTNADRRAQEIYVSLLRENFPQFGIVAEEKDLSISAGDEFSDTYFTVDPLDGTKAFVRRQSHGIGTMVALVRGEEIISAYVGDVMTEEIYGYRPESEKVHRISEFGRAERLRVEKEDIADLYISLREDPRRISKGARKLTDNFKDLNVESGSIGMQLARLWKGEVGAVLLEPGYETPWDTTPVMGISEKMGFETYKIDPSTGELEGFEFPIVKEPYKRDFEILIGLPGPK